MKGFSTLLILGVIAGAAIADAADAQTRYVRYEQAGDISWGELDGTTIRQLSDAPYLGGARTGRTTTESAVTMKAPVDPNLVFMTAFNFRSHISGEPAEYPGLFTVPASSIIGSGEDIVRPAGSQNLHYEAEMVVVISESVPPVSRPIPMPRSSQGWTPPKISDRGPAPAIRVAPVRIEKPALASSTFLSPFCFMVVSLSCLDADMPLYCHTDNILSSDSAGLAAQRVGGTPPPLPADTQRREDEAAVLQHGAASANVV